MITLRWIAKGMASRQPGTKWNLTRPCGSVAAVVYDNGVWHTFDASGVGGENSNETTVNEAMRQAMASAITQGFIPEVVVEHHNATGDLLGKEASDD